MCPSAVYQDSYLTPRSWIWSRQLIGHPLSSALTVLCHVIDTVCRILCLVFCRSIWKWGETNPSSLNWFGTPLSQVRSMHIMLLSVLNLPDLVSSPKHNHIIMASECSENDPQLNVYCIIKLLQRRSESSPVQVLS